MSRGAQMILSCYLNHLDRNGKRQHHDMHNIHTHTHRQIGFTAVSSGRARTTACVRRASIQLSLAADELVDANLKRTPFASNQITGGGCHADSVCLLTRHLLLKLRTTFFCKLSDTCWIHCLTHFMCKLERTEPSSIPGGSPVAHLPASSLLDTTRCFSDRRASQFL